MNQSLEEYEVHQQGMALVFEQRATGAMFLLAGFAMATWAALIPYAKTNVGAKIAILPASAWFTNS